MKVLVLGNGKLGQEIINQTGWDFLSRKKDNIDVSKFNDWVWRLQGYDVILNCIANTNTYSDNYESIIESNGVYAWLLKFNPTQSSVWK